jgi:hypothetical protein
MSMSLTGSCFSSESAPGPLYGVFFVKEFARAAKLSFVGFLFRSQGPFLRPDLGIADVDARREGPLWLQSNIACLQVRVGNRALGRFWPTPVCDRFEPSQISSRTQGFAVISNAGTLQGG